MKCKILHETRGRIRVHMLQNRMTLEQADILEYYLRTVEGVTDVRVFDRTCDVILRYEGPVREQILNALRAFAYEGNEALVPEHTGRLLNRQFEDKMSLTIFTRAMCKLFLPAQIRMVLTMVKSVPYLKKALQSLMKGKLDVGVLDAAAVTVSMIRQDWDTAASVMFMLKFGETLEEWTRKKTVDDLARTMSLNIDTVWLLKDGTEIAIPIENVSAGDLVVVRTGCMIPLDGKVHSGEAMVNQASMTGESLPVLKDLGDYVYAGTVVEEGECIIQVEKSLGSGRYDRICTMIEESEKLKSAAEDRAFFTADRLVPFSLAATALTYLFTRNANRAVSILMVDYSCALKLAIPIAVLSAMREGRMKHIAIKGGKYLEAIAEADTIVFDKTGTLTHACPTVAKVIPFGGNAPAEMLRLAACLEEHYPHSMANAVVAEAKKQGLDHEEEHSKVEYVVAHGISSIVNGQKVIIGSHHFVFQDEHCTIPQGEQVLFDALPPEYSHLYLAISGVLAAVICVEDPLREEAREVLAELHQLGLDRLVMMTGDSAKTARMAAQAVGVDEYHAEVLPEDKAMFVRREHESGRKVIMIGDGVNDSPALSEADVGVAIGSGAAIAREVADITLAAENLYTLITLRTLSSALMKRIRGDYNFIMSFNSALILLGMVGILPPAVSALLHNSSTLAVSLRSMTNLLP